MDALLQTAGSFAILLAIFLPLERLYPAHEQRVLRERWGTDLAFFLGQYLLWTAPVVAVLVLLDENADRLPLAGARAGFAALPAWLQCLAAVALSDLCVYWVHRGSHRLPLLWRFHRVHHTARRLDWLAAHREHPVDNLVTRAAENLPLILLGLPLHWLAGFAVFRGLWAIYIHSNCALGPGPLRRLLGAPRLHHWHHAVEGGGDCNFANLSPLVDLCFGTYRDPGSLPERYGIGEPAPEAYAAQLLAPLVPDRWAARARGSPRAS